MLGALLSTWIRNNLKRLELFDYLMHYIGCPAAVICLAVLPQLKAITEIGGLSYTYLGSYFTRIDSSLHQLYLCIGLHYVTYAGSNVSCTYFPH